MVLFKRSLPILALVLLLFCCRKPTRANWDIDAVLPLVNSSLNIKNFLGDTLFKTDNTGLLYLTMNREIASLKLDSLFNLPDTTISKDFIIPAVITVTPGQTFTFFTPSDLAFNIGNGALLKRVDVRNCVITAKFSNSISQPVDLVYRIPGATKDGQPFTIKETIPPGNASLVKEYNLAGYSMDLKGLSGKTYNTIYQTYTMSVNENASPTIVSAGQGARIDLTYSELTPQYIEGYFGQQLVDIPLDTVNFGINSNFKAHNFMLSEATMDFKVLNEIGAEFRGSLSNVKAINTLEKKVVPLSTKKLDVINLNRANKVGTEIFPDIQQFLFNSGNSNVTSFISAFPDKLTYQGSVNLNPLSTQVNTFNDFAFYNTGIRIVADITIPLRFTADYFTLTSNAAVDFSNVKQLDNVVGGNFVILATNGYPFNARLQAYMLNADAQVIDSLFVAGSNVITGGQLNTQNLVIAPSNSKLLMPVTPDKVERLQQCKSLKIVSTFLVPSSPPDIQLLESYQFDINIVAELKYNVGTSAK